MKYSRLLIVPFLAFAMFMSQDAFAGWVYSNVRITEVSIHNNGTANDIVVTFDRDVCYSGSETRARIKKTSGNFEVLSKAAMAALMSNKRLKVQTHSTTCEMQYLWIYAD